MKTFYLKILVVIILLYSFILSVNNLNTYFKTTNFEIINERQSVIIQLPNTGYIEIISKNDHITDGKEFFEQPFSTVTKVLKNSNLENSIARTNIHTEYIENGDSNDRLLRLKPVDSKNIAVEVYVNTQFKYIQDLGYSIQLDYSNRTNFEIDGKNAVFTDKGCTVRVEGEDMKYTITENKQTLILSKKYEPEVIFKFDLNIKCNK